MISSLCYSPNGNHIAAGLTSGDIHIIDSDTGSLFFTLRCNVWLHYTVLLRCLFLFYRMTGWELRLSVTHPLDVILLVDDPEGLYNFGKVFRLFFLITQTCAKS